MSSTAKPAAPSTLADYPFRTFDKVRYADTDRQGHVNNAAFSSFLETGRVEFLYDPANPLADADTSFVIASLTLDFLAEVQWPGRIDIGTGVARLGDSSIRLAQGLFQDGRAVAMATTVIVQVHDTTRRAHPLAEPARRFLERHLMTGGDGQA
jgi:acyl-CoA thioester hydrolase